MHKHQLIERLIKEGHITFDEALLLVNKEPVIIPPCSPTLPYITPPVFPDFPHYQNPNIPIYPGPLPVICSTTLNVTCQQ